MPFIRKHRLILVPLFAALAAGLGLLLVLRSQSEEPAAPGEPGSAAESAYWRVVERSRDELVELRNDHTREWKVTTEVERTDPETEEAVTETVVSRVREVGSNLCYRDAQGGWQPTVPEWEALPAGFACERSGHRIYFGGTIGAGYTNAVAGKAIVMRPKGLVLSDGVHSITVGEPDTNATGRIDERNPSRLVFADAFGDGLDADIEYVLECAAFHQNVVLREATALPDGFNAATAKLYVFTEIGLDAALADGSVSLHSGGDDVLVGVDGDITPASARAPMSLRQALYDESGQLVSRGLLSFARSRVYDSAAGTRNQTLAVRRLWRDATDGRTYLVEQVPYAWLAAATYPVTLDPTTKSDEIDTETWTADATYHVTGTVTVGESKTLTIEPGTVIKFADDTSIDVTESEAKIVAAGEPFRYIVFTSEEDDESGEDLTEGRTGTPAAGDYADAIVIGADASDECEIAYCKIGYASDAIEIDLDIGTIAHCIMRDCVDGIVMGDGSAPDVFNCLFDCSGYGILVAPYDDTFTLSVTNCTFNGCSYGLTAIGGPTASLTLTAYNNLFTNNGVGASKGGSGTMTLDYNGWYHNTTDVGGVSKGAHAVNLGDDPYKTTELGEYFVDTATYPGGSQLVNAGSDSASNIYTDPTAFGIAAPTVVSSNITWTTTWSKRSGDTGTVDIGYHHPRVDKLIDNVARQIGHSTTAVTLTIDPGVVTAFSGSSARLQFKADAGGDTELACDGEPDEPVVMIGAPAGSMKIEAKCDGGDGLLRNKVTTEGYTTTASITYTHFSGLNSGIKIGRSAADYEIQHCVFDRCYYGMNIDLKDSASSTRNCLFYNSTRGCRLAVNSTAATTITVRNCTYDRCDQGIYAIGRSEGNTRTCNILDCAFTASTTGIYRGTWSVWNEDYNAYWDCDTNAEDSSGPISIGAYSIVLCEDPYDDAWEAWAGQWYLDQDGASVDGGSRSALVAGLSTFTTDLGQGDYDLGAVDIGYHYPTSLMLNKTHFDNEAAGSAGEIDISYDYGSNVTYRTISMYNSSGDLVYQTTQSAGASSISITWDGQGNQTGYTGDLDTGTYTVVITGGAGGDEYTRFRVYIEQSADAALEITRPNDNETVDWL